MGLSFGFPFRPTKTKGTFKHPPHTHLGCLSFLRVPLSCWFERDTNRKNRGKDIKKKEVAAALGPLGAGASLLSGPRSLRAAAAAGATRPAALGAEVLSDGRLRRGTAAKGEGPFRGLVWLGVASRPMERRATKRTQVRRQVKSTQSRSSGTFELVVRVGFGFEAWFLVKGKW